MRNAISPSRRLMVTLRYLASGADMKMLSETMRIAPSTLNYIIPEVTQSDDFVMVLGLIQKNLGLLSHLQILEKWLYKVSQDTTGMVRESTRISLTMATSSCHSVFGWKTHRNSGVITIYLHPTFETIKFYSRHLHVQEQHSLISSSITALSCWHLPMQNTRLPILYNSHKFVMLLWPW